MSLIWGYPPGNYQRETVPESPNIHPPLLISNCRIVVYYDALKMSKTGGLGLLYWGEGNMIRRVWISNLDAGP